ncbi:hypothetical protein STAL104432_29685 [Streptomyces albus]
MVRHQFGGASLGVVPPGGGEAGGRGAGGAAAQWVVGEGRRAAVDRLGEDVPHGVVRQFQLGVGAGGGGQLPCRVVGEGGDLARGLVALLRDAAERVPLVTQRLSLGIGAGSQPAGGIDLVGEPRAVEVGFGYQVSCRVVLVHPLPALRVGDPGEPHLGVVGEGVAGAVGFGAGGRCVERAGGVAGRAARGVGVADEVALAVPLPGLPCAFGVLPPARSALRGPPHACGVTERVGEFDDAAEGVAAYVCGVPERVGHGDGEARGFAGEVLRVAERVGDGGQVAALVVPVAGCGAGRVRGPRQVAELVVVVPPHGTVRLGHLHRLVQGVVRRGRAGAVRVLDGGEVVLRVVGVARGVSEGIGHRQRGGAAVVPLGAGRVAQRVRLRDDLAVGVAATDGAVAEGVGVDGGSGRLVVGEGAVVDAVRAGGAHDAAGGVVLVAEGGAVAVGPREHPALVVVGEAQCFPTGVDDLGEVAGLVVAVAHHERARHRVAGLGGVRVGPLVQQPQCGDALVVGLDAQVVAARVADGDGGAVRAAVDLDAGAVAVPQRGEGELGGAGVAAGLRVGEGADEAAHRVGDGDGPVRLAVPLHRPAGALGGQDGLVRFRDGVDQAHAVGGDEDDPVGVDLDALVQRGGPARPEADARTVRGQMGPGDDEGQVSGQ